MTLTTSTEIRPLTGDLFRAQLFVHLHVDGTLVNSYVLVSGPRADIEDYVAGGCTLYGLVERWTKKGK